ncbi:unnamed protein product [Didymodactylos carnosus]|uniref:Uncharacterized protein n=1 Tax=Didymodactylos carnosus TaxID=1234261 RepID=A0A813X938_9BILA|nr:unnamed protein product [Didymodactylos carnosus]CAF0861960.1 unnamed protein product [Didymodactylos carnosus]CAF3514035.1 unnamed protein product [Didymodactylos carnosus]CAF3649621.1 unnamed protein product [Didymodactylos carnosus]
MSYRKLKITEVGSDITIGAENRNLIPCACAFHPRDDVCAISYENGKIRLYSTINQTLKLLKEFSCHSNCIFAIQWINDRLLCTTSGDQTAIIYDIETGLEIDCLRGHTSSVKSLCILQNSPNILSTGGRDSVVNVYDRRYSKKKGSLYPINSIECAHVSTTTLQKSDRKDTRSVTAVEFENEQNLYSCASADTAIKVWDLRYTYSKYGRIPKPKHVYVVPPRDVKSMINRLVGFSDMKMDSNRSVLFASCTNSKIYQFDLSSTTSSQQVNCYSGHRVHSFNIKLAISPYDQLLLTGSSDFNAYIYRVAQPNIEPVKIEHNFEEVTAVAYHPTNPFTFLTCSDDFHIRLWHMDFEDESVDEEIRLSIVKKNSESHLKHHSLPTLLKHRQYGFSCHKRILSSLFNTPSIKIESSINYSTHLQNRIVKREKNQRKKRTVSEGSDTGDENTINNTHNGQQSSTSKQSSSKRLCRSSEFLSPFGSSLTLLKSVSTYDTRQKPLIEITQDDGQLLSKSDSFLLKNHQQHEKTLTTVNQNLLLSKSPLRSSMMNIDMIASN